MLTVRFTGFVMGFGRRPIVGDATGIGAVVRKPPRKMLWGGGEDIASIDADVKRMEVPCISWTN